MQVIVPPISKVADNQRHGDITSPCLASPLLETPCAFPTSIHVKRKVKKTSFQKSLERKKSSLFFKDESLSLKVKIHTDCIFKEKVNFISLKDGSNVPIINTYNSADRFAIGARLEMLHNRYDIGPLILTLLDSSPLWIMLPEEIEEWSQHEFEMFHPRQTKEGKYKWNIQSTGLFPDWIKEKSLDVPKGLPNHLHNLIGDCLAKMGRSFEQVWDDEEYEVCSWPVATCSWYGFECFESKLTYKILCEQQYKTGLSPDSRMEYFAMPDMGQKSDPTWMALDRMIEHVENHSHCTCVKLHHSLDDIEKDIEYFGAFAKLLKYISHARLRI